MTLFDDNSSNPSDQNSESHPAATSPSGSPASDTLAPALAGDPLSFAPGPSRIPYSQRPEVPEDLRISWSWLHLLGFGFFTLVVMAVVPSLLAIPYLQGKHLTPEKLQNYLYSIPQFVVGSEMCIRDSRLPGCDFLGQPAASAAATSGKSSSWWPVMA